jgi:hypothetical protein
MDLAELSEFYDSSMDIEEFIRMHSTSLKQEQDLAYLKSEQQDLEKKYKKVHFVESTIEPKIEKVEPKVELDEPKPTLQELRMLRLKHLDKK